MKGRQESQRIGAAGSFRVFDCAPVFIATGLRAFTLRELIEGLRSVNSGSIQHHFWGRLLRPSIEEEEYGNDFAAWTARELSDKILAERLAVLNPAEYDAIEELREQIIEVVEERLDEDMAAHWATARQPFHFLWTQVVVFDTGKRVERPEDLEKVVAAVSHGSIFYHFIEARMRTEGRRDDFTSWLEMAEGDHTALCRDLMAVDPFLSSLAEIRDRILALFRSHFHAGGTG